MRDQILEEVDEGGEVLDSILGIDIDICKEIRYRLLFNCFL
jgi:hypothetical protein